MHLPVLDLSFLLQFVKMRLDLGGTANAIDVCLENVLTHTGCFKGFQQGPELAGTDRLLRPDAVSCPAQNFMKGKKRVFMANDKTPSGQERDMTNNRLENQSSIPGDLPDSQEDKEKLKAEETVIDLPDVKDIPGQEFVHVPRVGEMADTTVSSADEEGDRIWGRDDRVSAAPGSEDFDVKPDELEALRDTTYMPTRDEDRLRRARMDNVDFQGEPLNEGSFGEGQSLSGADLDTNTAGDETLTDAMGQGDEENKTYSVDDTDRDQPNENRTGA